MGHFSCPFYSSLEDAFACYPFCKVLKRSMQCRDILKGEGNIGVRAAGRGVLGVYYLLENITYYCQSEGGEDSSQGGKTPPFPTTRKYPVYMYDHAAW